MELMDELSGVRDALVQQMLNDTLLQRNLSAMDDEDGPLPTSIKITVVVVYLIVCVVGLVGNGLVMYVIIRYTKMKTATNIYIFNLAVADALVLATLPFQGTDVLLGFWPFGLALCKIVVAIDYYNMFTSIFTLTSMSVDRYIAVCHPVRSLTVRTPFRAKMINVAVWVLASAVGLPVMIMGQVEEDFNGTHVLLVLLYNRMHQPATVKQTMTHFNLFLYTYLAVLSNLTLFSDVNVLFSIPFSIDSLLNVYHGTNSNDFTSDVHPGGECIVTLPDPRGHWKPVFATCIFLFSFLIPVVIISCCYGLMIRRLQSVRLLSGSKEKDRNLRRITYMVLSVVAAFVLCWMPVQVLALIQALEKVDLGGSRAAMAAMHFCIALGYANSSLNPVLYAFLDENFKRCFREFCVSSEPGSYLEEQRKKSLKREEGECGKVVAGVIHDTGEVIDVGAIPACVN
ncbi:Nociceptin receptor [Triplophysa tibetana]|uniref:Nociceptin receptor n=1 Tax=Triplophysa tibetana TaxID=1572043 RepID=A0A5A9NEJ2_9TELE|nr:Nociceptin receptor [Triplophysa tibetana]